MGGEDVAQAFVGFAGLMGDRARTDWHRRDHLSLPR